MTVIITTALVFMGIVFVAFSKNPTVTGKTTQTPATCFLLSGERLIEKDVSTCCIEARKSAGCEPYKDDLYLCKGTLNVVMDRKAIELCEQ